MTILNKIKENAIRYPDRIAFQHETAACCGNRTGIPEKLTWQQLEDDSDFLAAYIDANFPDRTPVIVYGHKNPYMLVCFLACVKSARAYCPVDTSIPEQRVQAILDAVSPELILATEPFPLLRKYGTVLAAEQMRRIFCKGGVLPEASALFYRMMYFTLFLLPVRQVRQKEFRLRPPVLTALSSGR